MTIPISKNIALSEIPSAFEISTAKISSRKAQELQTAFYKLHNRLGRLLPMEKAFEQQLLAKLESMRSEVADGTFRRISMDFLSIRREQEQLSFPGPRIWKDYEWVPSDTQRSYTTSVPRFALFTTDSDSCTFTVGVNYDYWNWGGGPFVKFDISGTFVDLLLGFDKLRSFVNLRGTTQVKERRMIPPAESGTPYDLRNIWLSVKVPEDMTRLEQQIRQYPSHFLHALMLEISILHADHYHGSSSICREEFTFSTQFSGVLPDEILDRLPAWQQLFHEVYFVAEAADWAVSVAPVPQFNADPLVIGRITDDFWLLDKFDMTSSEEYVAREWTSR